MPRSSPENLPGTSSGQEEISLKTLKLESPYSLTIPLLEMMSQGDIYSACSLKELPGEQIKRKISFMIVTQSRKLPRNEWKARKELYIKNYKTLRREFQKDTNGWKGFRCL